MEDDDALANTVVSGDAVALAATAASGDPQPEPALPAQVGRYRIVRTLGAGGMGVVYLAIDPKLDRKVAIKVLRRADTDERLLREGQAIARLHHPNVVGVYDVGDHGDGLFIAMEYVPGGTLGAWLQERRPWRDVIARFLAAGRGVAAAHAAGLVHRDFKPDNVLLGDGDRVVVTDFGLARADAGGAPPTSDLALTRTAGLLGTPAYMSPEQLRGEPADARSDQFSFCVALWEALFGARPFDPPDGPPGTIDALRRAVLDGEIVAPADRGAPASITRALRRGLARDPAGRYPKMDDLLSALRPPRRVAPWIAGAVVLVAGAATTFALTRGDEVAVARGPDCDAEATLIDEVWNDAARATYLGANADAALTDDARWFDEVATAWRTSRATVCRSAALDDGRRARAIACLDDARASLVAAIGRENRRPWPVLDDPAGCTSGEARSPHVPRELRAGIGNKGVEAVISPQGDTVVYVAGGERGALNLETGVARPVRLPELTGLYGWSDDGNRLVASLGTSIVEVDVTTGAVTTIGEAEAVSPDLTYAMRFDTGVTFLERASGTEVVRYDLAVMQRPAWEPGGDRVAFVDVDDHVVVIDLRTRRVATFRHRATSGWGPTGVAWRREGVLTTTAAARTGDRIVELEVSDEGSLRSYPRTLVTTRPREMGFVLAADRHRILTGMTNRIVRVVERVQGRDAELPIAHVDSIVVAGDAQSGRRLSMSETELFVTDRTGVVELSVPRDAIKLFGLWDGRLVSGRVDGDQTALIEVGAPDGAPPVLTLPGKVYGRVLCNAWEARRCIVNSWEGDGARISVLGDPAISRHVDGGTISFDVASDGRRVVLVTGADGDGGFQILDLETGDATALNDPAMTVQRVRWGRGDKTLFYTGSIVDTDGLHFQLRRMDARPGAKPEVLVDTGDVWISDPVVVDDTHFLYTTTEFETRIEVLDLPE